MLIDVDLGEVRESEASRAHDQIGTMQFMAIEVLRRVDHTYRHDHIAPIKEYHMTIRGLKEVMNKFPKGLNVVKPLCMEIRKVLFPIDKDEEMMIGTPQESPKSSTTLS
ncbi:MAG: hypothetical protein M1825_005422 [Sarcosagium campestre]|nr:MAG: hypothetical protein M1825_005422 [Sarcosagium campestre]